ncbi:MAG: hypothetical protein KIH10_05205 [Candidatus Freyarchaeota archaeon]|nr:hypothetical protein [Candidatus Jordarchaeia archaeon]MBS7279322.1 hypothetical protein [Candidatus Jordarchaeia archaeon]
MVVWNIPRILPVLFRWSIIFEFGYKFRFLRKRAIITIALINAIIAKLICRYYSLFIHLKNSRYACWKKCELLNYFCPEKGTLLISPSRLRVSKRAAMANPKFPHHLT